MSTAGTPISPSRPKGKSEAVIHRLRNQIISGLKPATRLSTFNEMEQAFGVSRAVLREAVDQLKRDGFIYSVDRQGLYVADRPPHLSRFGLVFPNNPSCPEWPRFFTALQQEATVLQQDSGEISFRSYHDIARGPGSDSFETLCDDAASHRLAGLILMPGSHMLGQKGPLSEIDVPKLYICGAPDVGRVPSVATDEIGMCDRMIQWLRAQGRQRIAVVAMYGNSESQQKYLAQQKVPYRSHWVQTVGRDNQSDVRKIIALLMDYPADQRPDGLIILDDNLTEHAVGGLLECDLKIGQDLDVVAHCNWPWPVANMTPIKRVGYHARHVLTLALRAIELLRQGQPLATEMVQVPALFEEEIDRTWRPDAFDSSKS